MLTAEQLDSDWRFFTPVVQVTYIPYDVTTDANIGGEAIADIDALIQEPAKEEYNTPGDDSAYTQLRVWNLRASQMGAIQATKRGIIQESNGNQWVIIKCSLRSISTRWRCLCFALASSTEIT